MSFGAATPTGYGNSTASITETTTSDPRRTATDHRHAIGDRLGEVVGRFRGKAWESEGKLGVAASGGETKGFLGHKIGKKEEYL
jgi:hypothetical protein